MTTLGSVAKKHHHRGTEEDGGRRRKSEAFDYTTNDKSGVLREKASTQREWRGTEGTEEIKGF
jgi:hypothetical protein